MSGSAYVAIAHDTFLFIARPVLSLCGTSPRLLLALSGARSNGVTTADWLRAFRSLRGTRVRSFPSSFSTRLSLGSETRGSAKNLVAGASVARFLLGCELSVVRGC